MSTDEPDEDVTIYRDTWGVPHIYGRNEEAALFGQGYAQAEDRLPTIYRAYRKATGTMAECFGEEWIEHDRRQRLLGHLELSKDRYHQHGRADRRMLESFVSGIERYAEGNPDRVPEWACKIEPAGLVTLGWYVISGWQLGEAMGKLARRRSDKRASNEWVLGRGRTRDGVTMACIDPHVSWEDEWLFYESHLHGGDLHVFGFSPVGVPYVSLGHNRHLSWAMTTGGPDTSDVYEEEISQDGCSYRYDGEWRKIERQTILVKVRTKEGIGEVEREIARTHHGPIAVSEGRRAYSIKISLLNEVHLLEQIRMMNKARNLGEFLEGVSMLQLMPQNLMYADVHGNLYYQRAGRVPKRPKGYDWKRPVPGNTSKTEWLGIHPMEDLVQVLNPPAGFMQNCNISPGTMTFNSPMTAGRYPKLIYNTSTRSSNSRGRRFLEIMRNAEKVRTEDALAIMVDTKLHGTQEIRERLRRAYAATAGTRANLKEAVDIILGWDSRTDIDSTGMTLYTFWLRELRRRTDRIEIRRLERAKRLTEFDRQTMLDALDAACRYMQEKFGSTAIPWGRVNRGRRGGRSWPLAGCENNLRAIGTEEPDEQGVFYADRGQSCPTLVAFKSPIESYSAVPYGQSEDPESPHYTDQGERLFANCLLKPTFFSKEELLKNLESITSLRVSPQGQ